MRSRATPLVFLSLWLWVAGCDRTPATVPEASGSDPDEPNDNGRPSGGSGPSGGAKPDRSLDDEPAESPPPYRTSSRALVQWKRYAAFEADLMAALQLSREQVCVEMGDKSCVRDVHLVSLGGNEPYVSGLMKPSVEPLGTTATVVDRVLLSACATRARLDSEAAPQVFTALKLNEPLPPPDDPAVATTIRDLYRRLLAREPESREIELVAELAESDGDAPLTSRDFATLACFTIGSTTEFLFF